MSRFCVVYSSASVFAATVANFGSDDSYMISTRRVFASGTIRTPPRNWLMIPDSTSFSSGPGASDRAGGSRRMSERTAVLTFRRASATIVEMPCLRGAVPLKSGLFSRCSLRTTRFARPRLRRMLYWVL